MDLPTKQMTSDLVFIPGTCFINWSSSTFITLIDILNEKMCVFLLPVEFIILTLMGQYRVV